MAVVLPKPIVARIEWAEDHVAPFSANAVAIGITPIIATDFGTTTVAARAALQARNAAEDAARNANNDLRLAMIALTDSASAIINTVHAKADMVGDSVYSLASIPVPATPAPRQAPGAVTDFAAKLEGDGSISFTWKSNNGGSGAVWYQVWRRLGGEGDFTFLADCGEKLCIDATIPAGTSQVTYQIRALRTTVPGPWAQFNVNFGVGTAPPTVTQTAVTQKIAA